MSREEWARRLLAALGLPTSWPNVIALVAWQAAENTRAANNPLATTKPWPGATLFNAAGVRNYPSVADGIAATAATLRLGYYAAIRACLARSAPAGETLRAVAESPWGTGQAAVRALRAVLGDYRRYADVQVPGSRNQGGDMYDELAAQRDQQTHDAVARIETMLGTVVVPMLRDLADRVAKLEGGR
jgi:hypothetical protein